MKRNTVKLSLLLFMLLALVGAASAADVTWTGADGNWNDIATVTGAQGWPTALPGVLTGLGLDNARPAQNGNTVTINTVVPKIQELQLAVANAGTLLIEDGGVLESAGNAKIGNNGTETGTLTINAGGSYTVFGNRIMVGQGAGTPAIVNLNGGTLRMGSNGHIYNGQKPDTNGTININDGGRLITNDKYDAGNSSNGTGILNVNDGGYFRFRYIDTVANGVVGESRMNINGTGVIYISQNESGDIQSIIDAGKMTGDGVAGNVEMFVASVIDEGNDNVIVVKDAKVLFMRDVSYLPTDKIEFAWANQSGNATDYVGAWLDPFTPADGATGRKSVDYLTGTEGNFKIDPLAPGKYTAYVCEADGFVTSSNGVAFEVITPDPELTTNKPNYYPGQDIVASWDWQIAPAATDFVGFWAKDEAAPTVANRLYFYPADGAAKGSITVASGTVAIAEYDVYYSSAAGALSGKATIKVVASGTTTPVSTWGEVCAADPGIGGIVELTADSYTVDAKLHAKDGVTYKGVGVNLTVIDLASWTETNPISFDGGADGFLEDVKIINGTEKIIWAQNGVQYVTLKNVTVEDCSANNDGAAMSFKNGVLNIIDCTFSRITQVTNDAGVLFVGSDGFDNVINITGTTFTDCDTTEKPAGVMYVPGRTNTINITDCVITGCDAASSGGAFYVAGAADMTIDNCVFDTNSAKGTGGHVRVNNDSVLTITNSEFLNGTSDGSGGHIHVAGAGTLVVTDSKFVNGISGGPGGAINVSSDNAVRSSISNSLFANNTAGGRYTTQQKGTDLLESINNTYVNNTVGNGGGLLRLVHFADVNTPIICSNNIFLGNTIIGGSADGVVGVVSSWQTTGTAAVDFTVTNNIFYDNATTFPLVGGSDLDGGLSIVEIGRITDNPQLDPATFKPWATSPGIDGSDPAHATTTDIDGLPAVGVRDIGAYERVPGPQIATDGGTALVIPELWLRNATSAFLTLKVWNAGDEDLTIDAATFTETGFVAITSPTLVTYPLTLKPLIDNPNEIQDYQVGFDTGLLLNGSSSGDFSDTLSITGNSPISFPVSVYVKASNPLASVNSWMLYED